MSKRSVGRMATLSLAVLALACSDQGPDEGAIVTFAFEGRAATMRVLVTNDATIAQAESRIATGEGAAIPIGPIVRGAGIDGRYPFHFLPDSLELTELAIELCDGAPMTTAEQVDDFIEGSTGDRSSPRATWCPWGAYPIEVER